jgi:hypothetical protein
MKSQVSADLIIVLSVALIIFLSVFGTIDRRNDEVVSLRTRLYAKAICERAAAGINTVFLAGDGSKKTVELPDALKDNSNYLVDIYPTSHFVEVLWFYGNETRHYSCPILFGDLTGMLTGLIDDFNVSNEGNGSGIDPLQDFNECDDYCINRGYGYGVCRHHGLQDCRDHGEDPAKGNVHSICRAEVTSVCCCGYI